MLAGTRDQRLRQRDDETVDPPAGREQPEPEIGHDEVVAGAAGVQLRTEVTEPIGHAPFDRRVDVLVGLVEDEPPLRHVVTDRRERLLERRGLVAVEQAGVLQRADVRDRRVDVHRPQAHVEAERATERVRLGAGGEDEASAQSGVSSVTRRSPAWPTRP